MANTFLQADWRKLAMVNYKIDPQLLEPYLPAHTVLDSWNENCYISLVGFMFQNTRIKGFKVPFHVNFEEVNLRFYVRYQDKDVWKRGVVFIKEIVPKPALTFVANTVYKEHYETMPMSHQWLRNEADQVVAYKWKKDGQWHSLTVHAVLDAKDIAVGSEAEFITEHYWGYARINGRKTSEYEVVHPRWQVYDVLDYTVDVDFGTVYGNDFKLLNQLTPHSVFLAEGSPIEVKSGRRL
jgi:uncharacterized protein YqjF (DUF2071 family)